MSTYQLTHTTNIIRLSDGTFIPTDALNTDYQAYLAWVALGNTATAAAALPSTVPQQAVTALNYSNLVAIQCFKSSIAYPSAWQTYDTAVQNIINGTDTTSTILPSLPTLPTGLPSSFPSSAQIGSLA